MTGGLSISAYYMLGAGPDWSAAVSRGGEENPTSCGIRHGQNRSKAAPGGSAGPGPEGRTTQLKAEIYKLVLYEEGTFLPHQDSEKADEIFGITNTPVQSSALLG
jgi:hypothetical protein